MSGRLRSPEYLERLRAEKERLHREVFGQVLDAFPEASGFGGSPSGGLPPTDRIFLFISKSIPLETLRNYARDIADIGDPRIIMVMRGFVGGMRHVLPTRRFVLDVLRKDLACDTDTRSDCELYGVNLVIDPALFRRYDVQEVPTVMLGRDADGNWDGERQGLSGGGFEDAPCRISGDAEFRYLISRVNEVVRIGAPGALLQWMR